MKPQLYFAHPINSYDTELERILLAQIRERFTGYEILNPNAPEHFAGYRAEGMAYFLRRVLPSCEAGALLAFRDRMIGTGVFAEALKLFVSWPRRPVWEINLEIPWTFWIPDSIRCLTVEETRKRIRNPDGSPKPY